MKNERPEAFRHLPEEMQDMTEPQLNEYFTIIMRGLQEVKTPDCIGWMLIGFMDNGITQYAASVDPETAPQALRELADRLERRDTVKR